MVWIRVAIFVPALALAVAGAWLNSRSEAVDQWCEKFFARHGWEDYYLKGSAGYAFFGAMCVIVGVGAMYSAIVERI